MRELKKGKREKKRNESKHGGSYLIRASTCLPAGGSKDDAYGLAIPRCPSLPLLLVSSLDAPVTSCQCILVLSDQSPPRGIGGVMASGMQAAIWIGLLRTSLTWL